MFRSMYKRIIIHRHVDTPQFIFIHIYAVDERGLSERENKGPRVTDPESCGVAKARAKEHAPALELHFRLRGRRCLSLGDFPWKGMILLLRWQVCRI